MYQLFTLLSIYLFNITYLTLTKYHLFDITVYTAINLCIIHTAINLYNIELLYNY